ncbi:MAG: methyltransferase [Candidatus Portnoybacteria bacterium RIFCSPLOWO2_01_FULL_43_11]|uniref:Methyltransferase n=4 Tax=Candidatus Portnoyibacteriota TaxID=1817913 RepID=A0A1G2FBG5_9BACT|nr:MAG: methyltransferase [Candidatus Portnoybacteria bacterium RIFCSPHIGHO2_01_FULL_40_12b]OGZ39043.1 MAG: methyltransferase [Candidatus Portnoybacteria bacterium RIFCSPHIGHO2_12_FULL_40_11]OGZ39216.1 MAG: methyltransferase [Candidatus Portnoybacteria bacterium RIFCSPLOWO2_01_FULL_43_11]OGZ39753.1 MAG: methyltransferase [Candidatus Portnoybacteria bacterium RIFCSPLOWO2_02_FULL_40_15]
MKNKKFINKIICADTLELLPQIEENSIDVVLTDPPYFLDKLDNNWNYKEVSNQNNQYIIKSLPAGMKFDKKQGKKFYAWYLDISKEIIRILKPGGFFFSFSSPRLYHRMASAIDDAGFEIRDAFMWLYTQNQAKAMGVDHFIKKMNIDEKAKEKIREKLNGWKTPQIKSCFEPIAMAQKPTDQTYLNNMLKHEVGMFNTNVKIGDNMYPANVFTIDSINELIDKAFLLPKPTKKEKGEYNDHKTVKPLAICEYLIKLSAFSKNAVVLDPFVGSGTTAVAAKKLGRRYIGIDANEKYVKISEKRLKELDEKPDLFRNTEIVEKQEKRSLQAQLQIA